jgi:hypothetical protein
MRPRTALSALGAVTATVVTLVGVEMATPYQIPASAYSVDMAVLPTTTYNTVPAPYLGELGGEPVYTTTTTTTTPCQPEPAFLTAERRSELLQLDYGYWLVLAVGQGWPDNDTYLDQLARIIHGESRGYPNARSSTADYGLLQINWTVHKGWLADYGIIDPQQLYDPETNLRAALWLYMRADDAYGDGWQPWNLTR